MSSSSSWAVTCKHFSGYKPCGKSSSCTTSCASFESPSVRLLIVHLGALGAVVRSTSLLRAMKRKFPSSTLTWVTDAPADRLLRDHPLIDRVLTTQEKDLLVLGALEFEVAYVIDKSLQAMGVVKRTSVEKVYGFTSDARNGAILPATAAARELWELGLSDQQKFFVNRKPETQLMIEALELGPYQRDDYFLPLSLAEEKIRERRQREWSAEDKKIVVGINTGCSDVIAYKKLSVRFQREVIAKLDSSRVQVVLLGGPEDTGRNIEIAQDLPVIASATESGLRDGLISVAACDVILTGDSLGMHMAISQQKYTVAWFGPTCAHEIDLYGRGESILTQASCSPCWKRLCSQSQMCYDQVSLSEIIQALEKGIRLARQSSCSNSLPGRPAAQHPVVETDAEALA